MTPSEMILYGSAACVTGLEGRWLGINTSLLPVMTEAGVSVYAKYSAEEFPVLFCAPHLTPTRSQLAIFNEIGQATLCIRLDSLPLYRFYLQEYWSDLLEKENQDKEIPIHIAVFLANDYLATSLKENNLNAFLPIARTVASVIIKLVESREVPFEAIFRALYHVKNPASHLANVAFYQVILAKSLGMTASEILHSTTASMLHHIVNHEDDDISEELCEFAKPSTNAIGIPAREAFRRLSTLPELTRDQLLMIYQYQERIDGRGGPVGLSGGEIHNWAKMLAIVDLFDELTCGDPTTPGKSRMTAMKILMQSAGKRFDSELSAIWNETVLAGRAVSTGASI